MNTRDLLALVDGWLEHAESAYNSGRELDAAAQLTINALGVLRAFRSSVAACVANGRNIERIHIEVRAEASEPDPEPEPARLPENGGNP